MPKARVTGFGLSVDGFNAGTEQGLSDPFGSRGRFGDRHCGWRACRGRACLGRADEILPQRRVRSARSCARRDQGGLTRDNILDNIRITWLTNRALSGARVYWENWGKLGYFDAKDVSIPVAVSVFPDELYPAPRSRTEKAFPKLVHFNKVEKAGHFAAWEQPKLFSEEVRADFRSLRKLERCGGAYDVRAAFP